MIALTPTIPGIELPVTIYAKDQPEYKQLPCYKAEDGMLIVRWKLNWKERFSILLNGNLWHYILTFNQPLQPIKLTTKIPTVPEA